MELIRRSLADSRAGRSVAAWFDNSLVADAGGEPHGIDWIRVLPFIGVHLACVAVIWVGWSPIAVLLAVLTYAVRMFAITGFYHRYFAHQSFKAGRVAQFLFALLGTSAGQRGPLWWASQHRHHHLNSDRPADAHSPRQHGFVWSHMGWFLARENFATRSALVRRFAAYPELRFLDRFDVLVPLLMGGLLYGAGYLVARADPSLGTSGAQWVLWGFCISTVALYHATFTINSIAHCIGRRRYATADDSRNNWWLALLTFGEGWHNNHHHFPGSARQGFYWWEIDLTYYGLKLLALLRIIHDVREVPPRVRDARRVTVSTS